jgi:hypothetical protein
MFCYWRKNLVERRAGGSLNTRRFDAIGCRRLQTNLSTGMYCTRSYMMYSTVAFLFFSDLALFTEESILYGG